MSKIQDEISKSYTEIEQSDLAKIYNFSQDFIGKIACVTKQLSNRINEHLAEFSRNSKKDMDSLNELTTQWYSSRAQVVLAKTKLKEKKNMLFEKKLIDLWQIPEECKISAAVLLNNKEIAFKEMLPQETKDLQKLRNTYGYYSNKVKEEFERLCNKNKEELLMIMKGVTNANKMDLEQVKNLIENISLNLEKIIT